MEEVPAILYSSDRSMSEIAELEQLFREEILEVPSAIACFEARLFNSFASPGAEFPFAVFQVIPLDDNFGQARTSIQSVFLIDLKIYSRIPLSPDVDPAVAAVKEKFRSRIGSFETDNFRISIRHQRPISLLQPGARPDEKLMMRGSTYKAWVSPKQ